MKEVFMHSELLFERITESAPCAMMLVDQHGIVCWANTYAEKLFGFDRKELLGQSIEVVFSAKYREEYPGFRNMFFNALQARPSGSGRELSALRKDGTEFPMKIGLNALTPTDENLVLVTVSDITEKKQSEEQLRLVVEFSPNPMVLVSQYGTIILVNTLTERLFGYSTDELIGARVEMLFPGRFQEDHPQLRGAFFPTPNRHSEGAIRDLFAVRKDGSEFPVEIGLKPFDSAEGSLVLASITDITQRKIKETHRLKNDFLASMSHELRTPLNAVLGFSELMIDKKVGDLNAKQLEYLNDIHASGSHLLTLINNILDLSKIEAGKEQLRAESFNLDEVIQGVSNVLKPIASKKNIEINQNLSAEINEVRIDKNKFRQILYNLLSNAIKFSSDGGIVHVETAARGKNAFVLRVTDSGIGIAKENLKKLFTPFVQLDSGLGRYYEGSGLGLALTRNIVMLHHGEIQVESTLGIGSTFSIIMPIIYKKP